MSFKIVFHLSFISKTVPILFYIIAPSLFCSPSWLLSQLFMFLTSYHSPCFYVFVCMCMYICLFVFCVYMLAALTHENELDIQTFVIEMVYTTIGLIHGCLEMNFAKLIHSHYIQLYNSSSYVYLS
jgi:hypothetical protein